MEIWELGPKSPFWSLSTVLGAQYDQVGVFDVPISKILVDGGYWVCLDPIWVVWDPYGAIKRNILGQTGPF